MYVIPIQIANCWTDLFPLGGVIGENIGQNKYNDQCQKILTASTAMRMKIASKSKHIHRAT